MQLPYFTEFGTYLLFILLPRVRICIKNTPTVTDISVISHSTGQLSSKSDPCIHPTATIERRSSAVTNAEDTYKGYTNFRTSINYIKFI